ncbi:hypothetical protein II906_07860 [bacterium]|nr:hypothetical protein [bacterium]
MAERKLKLSYVYNILGNTQATIEAIQKYLEQKPQEIDEKEETPAASINRVIDSIADEELNMDLQKIIKNL